MPTCSAPNRPVKAYEADVVFEVAIVHPARPSPDVNAPGRVISRRIGRVKSWNNDHVRGPRLRQIVVNTVSRFEYVERVDHGARALVAELPDLEVHLHVSREV